MIRYAPESGGLFVGEEDGPGLVLLPGPRGLPFGPGLGDRLRALQDLARAMGEMLLLPISPERLRLPFPAGFRAWPVMIGDRYLMAFVWPAGRQPLDALYAVEAAAVSPDGSRGLPAVLVAPFVWLIRRFGPDPRLASPEEPEAASSSLSAFVLLVHRHFGGRSGRLRRMDRENLRARLLPRLWAAPDEDAALEILGNVPASGVDVALIALELGEALWDPDVLPPEDPAPGGFWAARRLARVVEGEGRGMLPWPVRDWALWWDLVRARRAGRPLPPRDWPPPRKAFIRGEEQAADPDLARGLFRALMEIAAREGRYLPAGRFRVRAPDLPLFARLGVRALRVAADPHGLWLRPLGEREEGEIFRLDRDLPPRLDLLEEPVWLAIAAALWHDLRVGVPRSSREKDREKTPPPEARRPRATRPLVLPRPFVVREEAGGGPEEPEAEWGEEPERARLTRAAHMVRGHLRRLPPGWKPSEAAREIAEGFGVVLPDGFTFVRPHVRGGRGGEEPPPEREAVARGLASLAMLG